MPPASMVAAMIMLSVMSRLGVRSWNATDSASSISDAYSRGWNHSTFFGTFIRPFLSFFWAFPSNLTIAIGIVAQILWHFEEQEQMHGNADDLGQLLPRVLADRLDG